LVFIIILEIVKDVNILIDNLNKDKYNNKNKYDNRDKHAINDEKYFRKILSNKLEIITNFSIDLGNNHFAVTINFPNYGDD